MLGKKTLQGVNKGVVVDKLILNMIMNGKTPDFVLCIGDDRSDEDMFESIGRSVSNGSLPGTAEIFACTVGQKPSTAKYYVETSKEAVKLLELLGRGPDQSKPSSELTNYDHKEAFEGFV